MKQTLLIVLLFLASCQWFRNKEGDNFSAINDASAPSDIYTETYAGVLPCADCPGLATELTLSHKESQATGTFTLKENYIERNVQSVSTGSWMSESKSLPTGQAGVGDSNVVFLRLNPEQPDKVMNYIRASANELISCGKEEHPPASEKSAFSAGIDFSLRLLPDHPKPYSGTIESFADDCIFTDSISGKPYTLDRSLLYSYLKGVCDFHKVHSSEKLFIRIEGIPDRGGKLLMVTNVTEIR